MTASTQLVCASLLAPALRAQMASARQSSGDAIRPGDVWKDEGGAVIEAHGGGVLQYGHTFYWFGEDRSPNQHDTRYVSGYQSADLVHWKSLGHVLTLQNPEGLGDGAVLERPKVYFNRQTAKFVLYFHLDDAKYQFARVGVAVSDSPRGPYQYVRSFRPLGQESRDIGQFVDDDGAAYLIFESRPTGGFFIARLSRDYLDVEKEVAFIKAPLEGGALIHHGGRYIVMGSSLTGWSPNPNVYATAARLSGPWSAFKDIAPHETNTYDSQSAMLLKVTGSKASTVIYMGDRWNPSALWNSRYIWMPLHIDGESVSLPPPAPWTLDVRTGQATVLTK